MTLPLIDFTRPDASARIHQALTDTGFLLVRNLGVDPALLESVFAASLAFFKGPEEIKQRCRYRSAAENFGYQGLTEENLDPTAPADLKQTFTMRNIALQPPGDERWPSAEFRALMQTFFQHGLEAGFRLQRAIAGALQLPENFFVDCHSGANCTLRLLYYPASAVAAAEGQLGAGAHTDYGLLTLLFQDKQSGLQVRPPQADAPDTWLDVDPVPGAIVVNSGDMLERWTNGRYASTLHRVRARTGEGDRLSIALFFDPDSETRVEAIPSCVPPGTTPRYPPVLAGEHLQQKLQASHKARFAK